MRKQVYIAGISKGNPGPAAIGMMVRENDMPIFIHHEFIGKATNNKADYIALLRAIEMCIDNGYVDIEVLTNNEIMVKQMNKEYKVKNKDLIPIYDRINKIISKLKKFSIKKIPKKQNKDAHRMAERAFWD